MIDNVDVYKRYEGQEFVIHTIIHPTGKTATMRWYSRKKPFFGSTKIDVIYEGTTSKVSLIKGGFRANDLWLHKKRVFIEEIDKYIAQLKAEDDKKKRETAQEQKLESTPIVQPKKQLIVKDVEGE